MSKKLGQGHVYYCVVSPLPLTIVKEHLRTQETSSRTFREMSIVHA